MKKLNKTFRQASSRFTVAGRILIRPNQEWAMDFIVDGRPGGWCGSSAWWMRIRVSVWRTALRDLTLLLDLTMIVTVTTLAANPGMDLAAAFVRGVA